MSAKKIFLQPEKFSVQPEKNLFSLSRAQSRSYHLRDFQKKLQGDRVGVGDRGWGQLNALSVPQALADSDSDRVTNKKMSQGFEAFGTFFILLVKNRLNALDEATFCCTFGEAIVP